MYESFGFRSAGVRRRYYHDNNEDALIMWRTRGRPTLTSEGSQVDDRSWRSRPPATTPARRSSRRTARSSATSISSQARFHERYGGVVPEVASRHHLELVNAVVDEALARGRASGSRDLERGRGHQRAGADRRAAGRPLDRQGARRGRAAAVRGRWTTCTATWRRTSSSRSRSSRPSCA